MAHRADPVAGVESFEAQNYPSIILVIEVRVTAATELARIADSLHFPGGAVVGLTRLSDSIAGPFEHDHVGSWFNIQLARFERGQLHATVRLYTEAPPLASGVFG